MRGVYKLQSNISSVTTSKTLAYISTASTRPIEIYRVTVTSLDETTSEQMEIMLNRISTLGTPTATTVTPKPLEEGSNAFGGTCKVNVTANEPTYDQTTDSICYKGENKVSGWEYVPLPEERPIILPSDNVGLKLMNTITSSTLSIEVVFREIG